MKKPPVENIHVHSFFRQFIRHTTNHMPSPFFMPNRMTPRHKPMPEEFRFFLPAPWHHWYQSMKSRDDKKWTSLFTSTKKMLE